jgi:hypothetical protein
LKGYPDCYEDLNDSADNLQKSAKNRHRDDMRKRENQHLLLKRKYRRLTHDKKLMKIIAGAYTGVIPPPCYSIFF